MSAGHIDRRALFALTAAALVSATPVRAQPAEGGLDGVWEGALENISGPGIAPPPQGEFPIVRLHIDQRNVRVDFGPDEVKPGTFEIKREGASAVISSIQSDPGAPQGASWIETWAFIVTLSDPDTLLVNYVRVVNNTNMREDRARFTQIRTGQFHRIHSDHVR